MLLRGLDPIRVVTLLEFTKPTLIAVTNVAPRRRNLRLSCQVGSKMMAIDGSEIFARKVFSDFRLTFPKTQVTARSEP